MYTDFEITEQQPLNAQLGFLAQSVIIDNVTASWMQVQGIGRFVPPFTYGFIGTLIGGTQQANVVWRTPASLPPPTAGVGAAQVIYTSEALTPSNGQQVVIPSQQVVLTPPPASSWTLSQASPPTISGKLISFTVGPSGPSSSIAGDFSVPAGTNSLIVAGGAITSSGSNLATFSITVTGKTTGTVYLNTSALVGTSQSPPQPPFACIVSPAADPIVTVTIAVTAIFSSNTVTGSVEVIASFGTQAVAVEGIEGATPVPVVPTAVQSPGASPSIAVTTALGSGATVTLVSNLSLITNRILYAASLQAIYTVAGTSSVFIRAQGGTSGNLLGIVGTTTTNLGIGAASLGWPIDILNGMNAAIDTTYNLQVVNNGTVNAVVFLNCVTGLKVPGVWT